MDKPNCYKCIHRRSIPGDNHSRCAHPAFDEIYKIPVLKLISALGGTYIQFDGIVGNPHGIEKGWFNHPFNFDPIWLMSCIGFKEREDEPNVT